MEKDKQAAPKTYLVTAEQLMDIMRYLMSRPYGEVVKIMNTLSALTPYTPSTGETDARKK
jgi:hypothetical protein|tara:strand:- start:418 stop:597 length:180 start_codon:yes stop_codon:yes gene_type:complete